VKRERLVIWREVKKVKPRVVENRIALSGFSPFDVAQNFEVGKIYEVYGAMVYRFSDGSTIPCWLVKNKKGVIDCYAMEGFMVVE